MNELPPMRVILTADVEQYSTRPAWAKPGVHHDLNDAIRASCAEAGIEWETDVYHADSPGDEVMVTLPVECLPGLLRTGIRTLDRILRNRPRQGLERMRLRAVVHVGPLDATEHIGPAKDHAARLLAADQLRDVLTHNPKAEMILLLSDHTYTQWVRNHYTDLEPHWFAPLETESKGDRGRGWAHIPDAGPPHIPRANAEASDATPTRPGGDHQPTTAPPAPPPPVFHQTYGNQAGEIHGDMTFTQSPAGPARSDDENEGDTEKR